jgi:hypothetical protein
MQWLARQRRAGALELRFDPHAQPQHITLQLSELPANLFRVRLLKLRRAYFFDSKFCRFNPQLQAFQVQIIYDLGTDVSQLATFG